MNVKNALKAFIILAMLALAANQIKPVLDTLIDNLAVQQPVASDAMLATAYTPLAVNRTAIGLNGYIFAFTQAVLGSSASGITQAVLLIVAVVIDVLLLPVEITFELFAALQEPVAVSDVLTIAILAVLINLAIAKSISRAFAKLPI